jgi:hypothetical protein
LHLALADKKFNRRGLASLERSMLSQPVNDWRSADAYRYTLSLPMTAWVWEFLRRNPDYQADCAGARAGQDHPAREHELAARWGLLRPRRAKP